MVITVSSENETEAIAARLARTIHSGGITIGLCGDLGAGKTTFVRYFVAALGSSDLVSSPSFVLQHQYLTSSGLLIEHWDLYRLTQLPEELLEPIEQNVVRLVEWADRCSSFLDSVDLSLSFRFCEDGPEIGGRQVEFAGSLLEQIKVKLHNKLRANHF